MFNIITKEYIECFLDTVQKNSVRNLKFAGKEPIDWKAYRNDVLGHLMVWAPRSPYEADGTIRYALRILEDGNAGGHSHLIEQSIDKTLKKNNTKSNISMPHGKLIGNTGYIFMPHLFAPPRTLIARNYAQTLHTTISELDTESLRGWIIDLRNNSGENHWSMLAGIGPLLGNGTHGYSIKNERENPSEWVYKNGAALTNGKRIATVKNPHILKQETLPIAVLMGEKTSSSGEFVLIAFKGLANVKTFGQNSYGNSTINEEYPLLLRYDTAGSFALATAIMADRNKNLYGRRISPDFYAAATKQTEQIAKKMLEKTHVPERDPLVKQALKWVQNQSSQRIASTPTPT